MGVRITVIVPAYRAWDTLPATLEALRPQVDRPDRELILVESSGTVPVAEIERRWPWLRAIVLPQRTLPGRARNLAAEVANGELLAYTDADAIPEAGWLDALEGALTPELDGVAGAILNGTPSSVVGTADYLLEFSHWLPRCQLPVLHGATCNLLLRRSVLVERGFPEDIFPGEDTIRTFGLGSTGRLGFAADARVSHVGRTGFRAFLAHQQQLGAAFASICEAVDFPHRGLARRRYALLVPLVRLVAVARRTLANPGVARTAASVTPLLVAGALAWSAGLLRARRSVAARSRLDELRAF